MISQAVLWNAFFFLNIFYTPLAPYKYQTSTNRCPQLNPQLTSGGISHSSFWGGGTLGSASPLQLPLASYPNKKASVAMVYCRRKRAARWTVHYSSISRLKSGLGKLWSSGCVNSIPLTMQGRASESWRIIPLEDQGPPTSALSKACPHSHWIPEPLLSSRFPHFQIPPQKIQKGPHLPEMSHDWCVGPRMFCIDSRLPVAVNNQCERLVKPPIRKGGIGQPSYRLGGGACSSVAELVLFQEKIPGSIPSTSRWSCQVLFQRITSFLDPT